MKLIIACDTKGGIGYQNKLPWSKIEGDLPRFKNLTNNNVVVMGKKTWESLPVKPLPNRVNIVVSKTLEHINEAIVLPNLGRLKDNKNIWVIGGGILIKSVWDYITEVHLTRIYTEYTCDTFIDLVKLETEFANEFIENNKDHYYEIWKRK